MNSKSKKEVVLPAPIYEFRYGCLETYEQCIKDIIDYLNSMPASEEFISYNISSPNHEGTYYRYSIIIKKQYPAA